MNGKFSHCFWMFLGCREQSCGVSTLLEALPTGLGTRVGQTSVCPWDIVDIPSIYGHQIIIMTNQRKPDKHSLMVYIYIVELCMTMGRNLS